METFHKVFCFNRRNFLITLITLINEKSKLGSYKLDNIRKTVEKMLNQL